MHFMHMKTRNMSIIQVEAYRRNLLSYQLPYLFTGGQAQKDNNESVSIDARVNYFGRVKL